MEPLKTAEAFTHDAVGTGAEGAPLTINWTAAPSPGSLMTFSLRFNSSGTAATPDAQIYCVFADDGSGEHASGRCPSPASRPDVGSRPIQPAPGR